MRRSRAGQFALETRTEASRWPLKSEGARLNFNTTRQSLIRAEHAEVKQRRERRAGGFDDVYKK